MGTRAKVDPRTSTPTHTLAISDPNQTWGLRLDGELKYMQETPQSPSTLVINRQGGEYGDFDPSMSHIMQNEWNGGRGEDRFFKDVSKFFDSKNAWTTSSGMVLPTLQSYMSFGEAHKQDVLLWGKNYAWKPVINGSFSVQFTAQYSYTAAKICLWLRKYGTPAALTAAVYSDNASDKPNASLSGGTVLANSISTCCMEYVEVAIDLAITAATKYHVVVTGGASDNKDNRWDVLMINYNSAPLSYTSPDATTWTATDFKPYFRVSENVARPPYKFFMFSDELYAVQLYDTGTNTSKLYKLTPTPNSFAGSTSYNFISTEITTTGLASVTDVLVINGIVYFAQGNSTLIRRWNGSTWASETSNKAHTLSVWAHADDGVVIYRTSGATRAALSKSVVKDWGTDLVFGTAIKTDDGSAIASVVGYGENVFVFKTDSIWTTNGKDSIKKFSAQIDDSSDANNGRAAVAHGQYLYFSLDKSVEQLFDQSITDVGPGRGAGLPIDRSGYVSNLESVFNNLFVSIDAGGGYSTISNFDGVSYHEVWRSPQPGKSINSLFWYSNKSLDYPYLVWDHGGEICFMRYPSFGFTPTKDTTLYYAPEAHIISSTIDMNMISLPKIFKTISVISKNLYNHKSDFALGRNITNDSHIEVDIQMDNDIDSDDWVEAGTIYDAPYGSIEIDKSNVYSLRYRLRLYTSDASKPPIVKAAVVEGLARTPIKYQWVLRVKVSSMQSTLSGAPDHNPDKLLQWLKEKASSAEILTLHSSLKALNLKKVFVEPPSVIREFSDPVQKSWGGIITLVLREA